MVCNTASTQSEVSFGDARERRGSMPRCNGAPTHGAMGVVRKGDRHGGFLRACRFDPHVDPAVRQTVAVGGRSSSLPTVWRRGILRKSRNDHHHCRTRGQLDPQLIRPAASSRTRSKRQRRQDAWRCSNDFCAARATSGKRAGAGRHGDRKHAGEPPHTHRVDARRSRVFVGHEIRGRSGCP